MCSKPWLLFPKPGLLFPLESLDVFLFLKQARAQPHCKHCSHFCSRLHRVRRRRRHCVDLKPSSTAHVCTNGCSEVTAVNYSFMLRWQHAGGFSLHVVDVVVSIMRLRTGAHIRVYIKVYKRRGWSHPPRFWLCQILVCSQTAEWQPFAKPSFYSNIHPPPPSWQTDDPPGPPTHSVDSIQKTTNTPTKLLCVTVCLIPDPSLWRRRRLSSGEDERSRGFSNISNTN